MIFRAIAIAVLLFAVPLTAAAEELERPVTRVLVLGDAIGGGLGAGLMRLAEASGEYEVSNRFNEQSGLARPEVYDWPATVPTILGSNPYDVVVVMLGANDTQSIRLDGLRIPFGAEGWPEAYAAQVDRLLAGLSASGARVVWVGPPPMRDPEYDAAVRDIAAIQRERAEANGITFIDMRAELSDASGQYAETGPDDTGMVRRLRGRDGISFYKAGNNRMGQIVLAAINSSSEAPARQAAGQPLQDAAEQTPQVPLFGQLLMNGEVYTVQPEGVTANAVMLTSAGLSGEAALKALRDIAPQSSGAERLFMRGEAPSAPVGRADDFSVPAPAP
jgi:hypothetical protein